MKKLIAMFLCVAMIASMSVVANAAIQLPDGGQIRPSGHSRAYGYTDGGTNGKAYMNCIIEFKDKTYGNLLATTISNIIIGNDAYTNLVAWQGDNELVSIRRESPASTQTSFPLPLPGGSATTMGTAGQSYSSSEYGDWICGTEVYK